MSNDPAPRINTNQELVLSVPDGAFAEFVTKLLGKPQTIEALFQGPFDLAAKDIENCFHIVDHRVKKQNNATLVQFIIRIDYDDNSAVTLNSLSEFLAYREVRPVTSVAAHLSWIYLIKFKESSIPEKQTIDLSISSDNNVGSRIFYPARHILLRRMLYQNAAFFLRISHTERTWGTDIENLMSGVVKSWQKSDTGITKFIYSNSGWIGLVFGVLFFVFTLWGGINTLSSLDATFKAAVDNALLGTSETKLDFLLKALTDNPSRAHTIVYSTLIPFISLIGSIIVAVIVANLADNPPKIFLILSEQAAKTRDTALKERIWSWRYFVGMAISSTVAGVASRYLFSILVVGWK